MSKHDIKQLIEAQLADDGLVETAIEGVKLFRVTEPMRCAPAVYEPSVIAIVNGGKEAILDGQSYVYDSEHYMCCPISLPVEAGTPHASPESPLLGVSIALNTRVMTELTIEIESAAGVIRDPSRTPLPQGFTLTEWDDAFTDAMTRLVQLLSCPADAAILGDGRLRELYYAVLNGGAGASVKRAFGVGNEIARSIEYLAARLNEPVTIEDMAAQVGMSRAVFHRKFKQATTMSPIQFVKSMRLNNAAMSIAGGMSVNAAARDPIVSLVQGAACGGGFSLALASDIRIAADTAKMNAAYINIGLTGCISSGAGMVWIHGGGMVVGKAKMNDATCNMYVKKYGLVVASVEYRLAPEHPYPAAIDDCFESWNWFLEHAEEFGVDINRIAIGGASAGGGLSAALAQRVYDTGGPQPAAQILYYPMLDDRTAARDELTPIEHIGWTNSNNDFGWSSYLNAAAGRLDETPPWASPGRREDLSGLAPAWIGVGDKDLFFEEDCDYAARLKQAGIECQLDIVEGGPHGFDALAPDTEVSKTFVDASNSFLARQLGV
eukprot:g3376.t1